MFGFEKKCHYCREKINGGVKKEVYIYGRVGIWKKDFCSQKHLVVYERLAEQLMGSRKACLPCALK